MSVGTKLWQNTTHLMSPEQALVALPGASLTSERDQDKLASGAVELLRGQPITISNQHFMPKLYFLNNQLEQVTLGLEGTPKPEQGRSAFEDLTLALRTKYGPEIGTVSSSIGKTNSWFSDRTNIILALMIIANSFTVLNICYQVRISDDAQKL